MNKLFTLLLSIILSTSAFATDQQDAYNEAKDFGKNNFDKTKNIFGETKPLESRTGIEPKSDASKYDDGNMSSDAISASVASNTTQGQASTIVKKVNPITVNKNDEWVKNGELKTKQNQKNLKDLIGQPKKVCRITKGKTIPGEDIILTCDFVVENKTHACTDMRDIQIGQQVKYGCTKQSDIKFTTCDGAVEYPCKSSINLGKKDFKLSSSHSDITIDYVAENLYIGNKFSDHYWQGNCKSFIRKYYFYITDVQQVEEFSWRYVYYKHYILIKVNGKTIYSDLPSFGKYCRTSGEFEISVDHDLKSYLKNGKNTIFVETFVLGKGTFATIFGLVEKKCLALEPPVNVEKCK